MSDRLFDRVPLVVVDAHALLYTRYIGTRLTNQVVAEEPLFPAEVEWFRKAPGEFLNFSREGL